MRTILAIGAALLLPALAAQAVPARDAGYFTPRSNYENKMIVASRARAGLGDEQLVRLVAPEVLHGQAAAVVKARADAIRADLPHFREIGGVVLPFRFRMPHYDAAAGVFDLPFHFSREDGINFGFPDPRLQGYAHLTDTELEQIARETTMVRYAPAAPLAERYYRFRPASAEQASTLEALAGTSMLAKMYFRPVAAATDGDAPLVTVEVIAIDVLDPTGKPLVTLK